MICWSWAKKLGKKGCVCLNCKTKYIDYVGFDELRSSPILISKGGCPKCGGLVLEKSYTLQKNYNSKD